MAAGQLEPGAHRRPTRATNEGAETVMDPMMTGMGLWGLLLIVALLAVLVVAILGSVWLFRQLRPDAAAATVPADSDGPRDLLRRRYAVGEIDDEEYERRLSALTWR